MSKKIKIAVVGTGYVGMSLAVLLAKHNHVVALDIDPARIDLIRNKQSTVDDDDIRRYLSSVSLCLEATTSKSEAYMDADFIIVATPTDYDDTLGTFDTSSVDLVVKEAVSFNRDALIVIKSTLPIGYTKSLQGQYGTDRIVFSPEFLREGLALHDNLYPSRIIIGSESDAAGAFVELLKASAEIDSLETLYLGTDEAEAVKLFANTYLAMRVSFFNELDSYAMAAGLDTKQIIDGICLDDRIGDGYNNPSFGYGGYCLPKDTRQLLANFSSVPQNLIQAIVNSNSTRKDFLATEILKLSPKVVGFYRLVMKEGSDNYRSSAIQGLIERVSQHGITIVVFEPSLNGANFGDFRVINNLDEFKNIADVIVANRFSEELQDVGSKVFSRDVFGDN